MKAIFVAIATIGLAGCTMHGNGDVREAELAHRKADLSPTPSATSAALAGEDEIRPSCEKKWAGDWAMIALCVKTQTQGFRDMQRLVEEHNIRNGDTTPRGKDFHRVLSEVAKQR